MTTRGIPVLACALTLTAPATALAQSPQTITALGTGQAKVKPKHPHRNPSIKAAVDAAYARAVPAAIADAREDAARIAAASNLTLGEIESVDENVSSPGAEYYGPPANIAPFGPNQYCATITRRRIRHDAAGRRHVHRVRRHVCYVPSFAFATFAVTFAASPAG